MLYRFCSILAWLFVAATGLGWWFQLSTPLEIQHAPALARDTRPITADPAQWRRLLGAPQPAPDAPPVQLDPRYRLAGVIAEGNHAGAALIAEGEKPPRVYRVGMELAPGLQVLRLQTRSVELGPVGGPTSQTLQLPVPAAALGSTMPAANAATARGATMPPPPPSEPAGN